MFKKGFLILVAGLFLITSCNEDKADVAEQSKALTQSTVYYFHSNARCMSCHKIENYTKEVFEENFKDKLDLKIVNIDEQANRHFINDYQLYTKSVVLVKVKEGKEVGYKNLDKVWNYFRDEKQFKKYMKNEIDTFLINQGE